MNHPPYLGPGWQDCADNELRDLIEMNERQLEVIRGRKRFRGQKAIIRRITTRLAALQGEEDRRIKASQPRR